MGQRKERWQGCGCWDESEGQCLPFPSPSSPPGLDTLLGTCSWMSDPFSMSTTGLGFSPLCPLQPVPSLIFLISVAVPRSYPISFSLALEHILLVKIEKEKSGLWHLGPGLAHTSRILREFRQLFNCVWTQTKCEQCPSHKTLNISLSLPCDSSSLPITALASLQVRFGIHTCFVTTPKGQQNPPQNHLTWAWIL